MRKEQSGRSQSQRVRKDRAHWHDNTRGITMMLGHGKDGSLAIEMDNAQCFGKAHKPDIAARARRNKSEIAPTSVRNGANAARGPHTGPAARC